MMPFDQKKFEAPRKKVRKFWKLFRLSFGKIHLVDKCLLMLMLLLLTQSAYVLFSDGGTNTEVNHIDIIVRTSAASIFGYLISANFVSRTREPNSDARLAKNTRHLDLDHTSHGDRMQNPVEHTLSASDPVLPQADDSAEAPVPADRKTTEIGRLQIITATIIATFCLFILFVVRDVAGEGAAENPSASAVLSQFRDFVSGCIGFLIGCPTVKSSDK